MKALGTLLAAVAAAALTAGSAGGAGPAPGKPGERTNWTNADKTGFGTAISSSRRAWPLLTGERGEYELAAGRPALLYLRAMARSANQGRMLPEQVRDEADNPTRWGFRMGEGTLSATPLAWSHAQFIRLARSIDAGEAVERPEIVACRYAGC